MTLQNDEGKFAWDNLDEYTKRKYAQELYDFYLLLRSVKADNEKRGKRRENDPVPQETEEMKAELHQVEFNGKILQRGFWLYIWQISTQARKSLFYVGGTGDSSSQNAQSPFNRMTQHLGTVASSNMLRKHLEKAGLRPEDCRFKLISFGPIFDEDENPETHFTRRDKIAALEKGLAEAMISAGYSVLNVVKSTHTPEAKLLRKVLQAFAQKLPKLRQS